MLYDSSRRQQAASLGSDTNSRYEQISMYSIPSQSNDVTDGITSYGDQEPLKVSGKHNHEALPDYAAAIRQPATWWSLHSAWIMYAFLLLGSGFAIGHHQYYLSLHGTPADDQVHKMRYGTVLAFLTKASLVAAVIAAFRQRIWASLVSTSLALETLDCLTAAPNDLLAAVNPDLFRKAKIAVLMAWLSPTIVILASQSLSVEPTVDVTTCPGAKVLNLTREMIYDFRDPPRVDGIYLGIVSTWNATTPNTTADGWFDYYNAPHDTLQELAALALFQEFPATGSNASNIACGHGWDCNFTVNFNAPGYRCDDVAIDGTLQSTDSDIESPVDVDLLLPNGQHSYFAVATQGDYARSQLKEVWPGGMPLNSTPSSWPAHLGVFRTEPILWIGYVSQLKPFDQLAANNTVPGWNESFSPNIIRCENYETEYTVLFEYISGFQNIRVLNRKYIAPIMNTTFTQDMADDGTADNTTAVPETSYVHPRDKRYKYVATYHAFGSVFRDYINGTINSATVDIPYSNTKAIFIKLFDKRQSYLPVPDFKENLQSLFENIILSVFSNPMFTIVTWAAAPDQPVGLLENDGLNTYPCTRSKAQNRFKYHAQDLWIVYGISLLITGVAVAMGTISVVQNEGVLKNTRYSSITVLLQHCGIEYSALDSQGRVQNMEEET
ncbi:hypothetical protein E8E14_010115 [Neopestalotiopsis sp. 37M]|nr:hypothetical protein E8E14_010115 [Neopestalotiopsis sp. 37M]